MKKAAKFLQSMKFGMVLLALVLVCSVVGSVIPQGKEEMYYLTYSPNFGETLMWMQLDHVFQSWYFIVLLALLCVNLLFCSVLRIGRTVKGFRAMPEACAKAAAKPVAAEKAQIAAFLKGRGFHRVKTQSGEVYARNRVGHYGTFVVHLAFLLLLVCAAGALFFSANEDVSLREGETLTLANGSVLRLDAFSSAAENGTVAYKSSVTVTDESGAERPLEITVNHPVTVSGQKLFQMGYGIEGVIAVTNEGKTDTITMTNEDVDSFLTLDGEKGVVFGGIYPDYTTGEDGSVLPVYRSKLGYPNPVYSVYTIDGDDSKTGVVIPGTTLSVGGVEYTFEKPLNVSTLRVKTYPPVVFPMLYATFALLIAGIFLTFFMVPAYVRADEKGYALTSLKPVPEFEAEMKARLDGAKK